MGGSKLNPPKPPPPPYLHAEGVNPSFFRSRHCSGVLARTRSGVLARTKGVGQRCMLHSHK